MSLNWLKNWGKGLLILIVSISMRRLKKLNRNFRVKFRIYKAKIQTNKKMQNNSGIRYKT